MIFASEADKVAAQLKVTIARQKATMVNGEVRVAPSGSGSIPVPSSMEILSRAVQAARPVIGLRQKASESEAKRPAPTLSVPPPGPAPPAPRPAAAPAPRPAPLPMAAPSSDDYQLEPKPRAVRSQRTGLYQPVAQGEPMERITFRLPVALGADLRKLARRYHTTSSEAVRIILADGVRHEMNEK